MRRFTTTRAHIAGRTTATPRFTGWWSSARERASAFLTLTCGVHSARMIGCAVVVLVPLAMMAQASAIWNANATLTWDDAIYARACLKTGILAWVHDYGVYRILTFPLFSLATRSLVGGAVPHPLLSLVVLVLAAAALASTCRAVGLSQRRSFMLFGLLVSSPFLLETLGFWAGAMNQAVALLFLAIHLRVVAWARGLRSASWRLGVVATMAMLALLTYETVLPFVVLSALMLVTSRRERWLALAAISASVVATASVLHAVGWYNTFRWTMPLEMSREVPDLVGATSRIWADRVAVYAALVPSLATSGARDWAAWLLAAALAAVTATGGGESDARRAPLSRDTIAACFGLSVLLAVVYVVVAHTVTLRYFALVSMFGGAGIVWARGRVAYGLAALVLILQCTILAGLPAHLRDAHVAGGSTLAAHDAGIGDLVVVDGRLSRRRWAALFTASEPNALLSARPIDGVAQYLRDCQYR